MLQDAELRLAILEDQRRVVDEYMTELRSMNSADALSTIDGTDQQLEVIKALDAAEEPVEAEWSEDEDAAAEPAKSALAAVEDPEPSDDEDDDTVEQRR